MMVLAVIVLFAGSATSARIAVAEAGAPPPGLGDGSPTTADSASMDEPGVRQPPSRGAHQRPSPERRRHPRELPATPRPTGSLIRARDRHAAWASNTYS